MMHILVMILMHKTFWKEFFVKNHHIKSFSAFSRWINPDKTGEDFSIQTLDEDDVECGDQVGGEGGHEDTYRNFKMSCVFLSLS